MSDIFSSALLPLILLYPILVIFGAVLCCLGLWFFLRLFQSFGLPRILGEIISEVVTTFRKDKGNP